MHWQIGNFRQQGAEGSMLQMEGDGLPGENELEGVVLDPALPNQSGWLSSESEPDKLLPPLCFIILRNSS